MTATQPRIIEALTSLDPGPVRHLINTHWHFDHTDDLIKSEAATAPINVHKLRGNVSLLEGSGRNVAVIIESDGKVLIDAGISVSH